MLVRIQHGTPNSGIEEFGRPRQFHMLEIIGSNPIPASKYRASGIFEDLAWFLLRGRGATPKTHNPLNTKYLIGQIMYTLKTIRKFSKEDEVKIYNTVPFHVNEEEFFYCLEDDVIIQYHWEDYDRPDGVVASVISGERVIFVHKTESAYLMNDKGQTVKVINRP